MRYTTMMIAALFVSFGLCGMAEAAPKITIKKTRTCHKKKNTLSIEGREGRKVDVGKVKWDNGREKRGVRFTGKNDGKLRIGGVNKATGTKKRGVSWKSPSGNITDFGARKKNDGTIHLGIRFR